MKKVLFKFTKMKKIYILLIAIFTINIANAQNCGGWYPTITGVPNTQILYSIYFIDTNVGFAVGAYGTILKTIDAGSHWIAQTSATSNDLYSVFFTDVNTGYVAGAGSTLKKTTNGGTTWTPLSSSVSEDLLSVFFTDANTGYVVTINGNMLKTTNGGTNWSTQSLSSTFLKSVFFINANTGYVVGENGKILQTTNAGVSWTTQTSGTTVALRSVYFVSLDTGYIVGGNSGNPIALKTTNAGLTWTPMNTGSTQELESVFFTDANTGYAVGMSGTLLKTINGGTNWTTMLSGQWGNFHTIYFSNSSTGYAATGNGNNTTILKTSDKGVNWSIYLNTFSYGNFISKDTAFAQGSGYVQKTTDGGANWTLVYRADFNKIYFINSDVGYGIWSSEIYKTTDGGHTWITYGYGSNSINTLFFLDSNTFFGVCNSGDIIKKTIGGVNYTEINTGTTNNLLSIYFINADTGYVGGSAGTILKTTNGGTNWTPQTSGTTHTVVSLYFLNADTGYAVGGAGTILKTTNGGNNWTLLATGSNIYLESVYFTNSLIGYAVGTSGTILKTYNGGLSWVSQSIDSVNTYCNIQFLNSDTAYIFGTNILKTTTAGESVIFSSSLPTGLNQRCVGVGINPYKTIPVLNATSYVWAISPSSAGTISGTDTIGTVIWNPTFTGTATVSVYGTNGTCNGNSNSITINVQATPAKPTSGNNGPVCNNSILKLTASTITGATYSWTGPNNFTSTLQNPTVSSSATIAMSGLYKVSATVNGCTSPVDSTVVVINQLPTNANIILGTTTVCQGQNSITYSVPAITYANSYVWSLPSGASGTSSTDSIIVNYGTSAVSGSITVKGNNSCGNGTASTLAIVVNHTYHNTINPSICQGQTYHVGIHTYSTAGTYIDSLSTLSGCDSIITTNLTVNLKPATPIVTQTVNTLHSSAASGNQWYNAASGVITGATAQTYNPTSNAYYYVIVTINGCSSDSSSHYHYVNAGIEENENNNGIKVYPNPVSNELVIEMEGNKEKVLFEIYNSIGQSIYKGNLIEKTTVQTTNFAQGIYIFKLENGKVFEFKKIVKE